MKKYFHFSFLPGCLLFCAILGNPCITNAQIITTISGDGTSGSIGDGGLATAAEFAAPTGISVDASGNIYISDYDNCNIRKISTSGYISTVAGNGTFGFTGDGTPATSAQIDGPAGIAFDGSGNMYIADADNNRVRKVSGTSGIITTIAGSGPIGGFSGDGGPATLAELSLPSGVAVDAAGNVYIGDGGNGRVRKINTLGVISTYAGGATEGYSGDGGPSTAAKVHTPAGMVTDAIGNLYFADDGNSCIRKIDTAGIITTVAGNDTVGFSGDGGPATAAKLNEPTFVTLDANHNLFFADDGNNRIRRVTPQGIITTIAGNGTPGFGGDGSPAIGAEFKNPSSVALDNAGHLYIADQGNYRIRKIGIAYLAAGNIQNAFSELKVYPNPSSGAFTISLASPVDEEVHVAITNLVGEKVKEFMITTNVPSTLKVDAPPGMYFLTAVTAQGKWSEKILITAN